MLQMSNATAQMKLIEENQLEKVFDLTCADASAHTPCYGVDFIGEYFRSPRKRRHYDGECASPCATLVCA